MDVMLESETDLKPTKAFKIRNYETYRRDKGEGRGREIAKLVKKGINHNEQPKVRVVSIEEKVVKIKTL